jgi:diguanylate cyclase (GGDEF)-like protein
MTGEDFVKKLRTFRPTTQVVLQTGYASEHPPRELLRRLDIQGFHDKSDGPDKLSLWVDVGLKAAFTIQLLNKSRQGLRYILDVTPELHRIQPLADLLQGILLQTAGLIGATHSFVASVRNETDAMDAGFLGASSDPADLRVRAVTGRFQKDSRLEDVLDANGLAQLSSALRQRGVSTLRDATIAPLRIGERTIGVVYLDGAVRNDHDAELVEVFANQAAVAIQNVTLYEMAALDPLTSVSTRRFFEQAMAREMRSASRSGTSVGLIVVDVDKMKVLNDRWGHGTGDRALAAVAACLRGSVRATDVVGRLGGDEFAILLPDTDALGVAIVLQRVRRALGQIALPGETGPIPVQASAGSAVLDGAIVDASALRDRIVACLDLTRRRLFDAADRAMYDQKRGGPDAPGHATWLLPPARDAPGP